MRVNIYLLVLVLGYKAAAGIIHEIVEEKTRVSLRCPHSVEGDVTWSRERNGDKTDILTVNGGREIKHIPGSRYGSLTDKSLFIVKAVVSDSGRYFCNNEAAADLTVIPSGTTLVPAPERTSITLTCPHDVGASHVPTWTRDSGGIPLRRFDDSPVDQTLTITDVQPGDSGLYYCDGKPAVYLNVIKGHVIEEAEVTTVPSTPPRTDKDTTTTKKQKNKKKRIIHEIVEEKDTGVSSDPHSMGELGGVEQERNGDKTDVRAFNGDRNIKHVDDRHDTVH
ncbi:uncharacterized protein LOC120570930 [Perca fluviatilis]|uniref:uncharacterized protein LOC120570930 n=1 Tax=Perca fluviatilis TaxID=8168 RepID=UPI0019624DF5|nr:uncharacterized protein LOC120570930 [Perca fluviatilis]